MQIFFSHLNQRSHDGQVGRQLAHRWNASKSERASAPMKPHDNRLDLILQVVRRVKVVDTTSLCKGRQLLIAGLARTRLQRWPLSEGELPFGEVAIEVRGKRAHKECLRIGFRPEAMIHMEDFEP
jgi:hypothetical protein